MTVLKRDEVKNFSVAGWNCDPFKCVRLSATKIKGLQYCRDQHDVSAWKEVSARSVVIKEANEQTLELTP